MYLYEEEWDVSQEEKDVLFSFGTNIYACNSETMVDEICIKNPHFKAELVIGISKVISFVSKQCDQNTVENIVDCICGSATWRYDCFEFVSLVDEISDKFPEINHDIIELIIRKYCRDFLV